MASRSAAAALRRDELADLRQRVEALERRIEPLEATPPRDAADVALRRQLATSTEGRCFTASELLKHAAIDGALRAALLAARLQGSHEVGSWLRDQRGTSGGITITRVRRQWICSTCDT